MVILNLMNFKSNLVWYVNMLSWNAKCIALYNWQFRSTSIFVLFRLLKVGVKIETLQQILPFRIRRTTSVPLEKGTKFALHHRKMLTTKRCTIQILHISTFIFTYKCGCNDFISKYTDINSLHIKQIDLLQNDIFCSFHM